MSFPSLRMQTTPKSLHIVLTWKVILSINSVFLFLQTVIKPTLARTSPGGVSFQKPTKMHVIKFKQKLSSLAVCASISFPTSIQKNLKKQFCSWIFEANFRIAQLLSIDKSGYNQKFDISVCCKHSLHNNASQSKSILLLSFSCLSRVKLNYSTCRTSITSTLSAPLSTLCFTLKKWRTRITLPWCVSRVILSMDSMVPQESASFF